MTTWGLRESSSACATMSATTTTEPSYGQLNADPKIVWSARLENVTLLVSTGLRCLGRGVTAPWHTENTPCGKKAFPGRSACPNPTVPGPEGKGGRLRPRHGGTHPSRPPPRSPSGRGASPGRGTARRSGTPAPCRGEES